MFILIFLILIIHTVLLFMIYSEIEKTLDNTFENGNNIMQIKRYFVRFSRKGKK